MNTKNFVLIISAPSGAGKSTIVRRLMTQDDNLRLSLSATTRAPRPGETDGQDYLFTSREEFEGLLEQGEFFEHAKVYDNYYGTPKKPVLAYLKAGYDVILEIDGQGHRNVCKLLPPELVVSIFIAPPSLEVLEQRLIHRRQDSDGIIAKRMREAGEQMRYGSEFMYYAVNDCLEQTVSQVHAIITAERHRTARQLA